jgi:hypothetical protein
VVIGGEEDTIAASSSLQSQGLWVPAIRPPTVPAGTSRLRVTLSAAHTDEQVDRLADGLAGLAGHLRGEQASGREMDQRNGPDKEQRNGPENEQGRRSTEPDVLAS